MVKFAEEIDEAIEQLFEDKNHEVDLVVLEVGKGEVTLLESGKGARAKAQEICEANEDKVLTGAFLALAVDDREVTRSIRRKYIHFIYVGPNVGAMQKGRVNSQSGELKNKFPHAHLYVQCMGDCDDLSEEALERALRACGGAHQPTAFDFTNSALEE